MDNTQDYQSRARGYKTYFMLNSADHEILNAHKYKNIKKLSIFQAQISLECNFPAHKCWHLWAGKFHAQLS